jgi:FtsH-binding integral membrane protein
MNELEVTPPSAFSATAAATGERVTAFLRKVYGWMFVGLGISSAVALSIAASPSAVRTIAQTPALYWGLWIATFGLAMFLQARVEKLSPGVATVLFVTFSAIVGAWLSPVLLIYTGASVATTFVVTAGMFGALALYGTTTKRSLAGWGQFLFMGFIGVFLALLVSAFWKTAASSAGLQFGITIIGVIVFTGLAAYHAQQLKVMAVTVPEDRHSAYAVVGALSLYITFINLFLMLLRVLGGRRN